MLVAAQFAGVFAALSLATFTVAGYAFLTVLLVSASGRDRNQDHTLG